MDTAHSLKYGGVLNSQRTEVALDRAKAVD